MQHTSTHMVSTVASITQARLCDSLPTQISNHLHRTPKSLPKLSGKHTHTLTTHFLRDIQKMDEGKAFAKKRLPPKNIPVVQAMFSLPQQIYTVVSDGPGFLLKRSPPIINSMAADTARHLHSSLTLQDCSQGLEEGLV